MIPITRIEGHLRIEAVVKTASSRTPGLAGTMCRGIEKILKGRDPREAWYWTQRFCGVCTTVHSVASVRAVENALKIAVPPNAEMIRNLIMGIQNVQDHVIHFYHLHALDWVDIVSGAGGRSREDRRAGRQVGDYAESLDVAPTQELGRPTSPRSRSG